MFKEVLSAVSGNDGDEGVRRTSEGFIGTRTRYHGETRWVKRMAMLRDGRGEQRNLPPGRVTSPRTPRSNAQTLAS